MTEEEARDLGDASWSLDDMPYDAPKHAAVRCTRATVSTPMV